MNYDLSDKFTGAICKLLQCDSGRAVYDENYIMDGNMGSGYYQNRTEKQLRIHVMFLYRDDLHLDRAYAFIHEMRALLKNGAVREINMNRNSEKDLGVDIAINVHNEEALLQEFQDLARKRWDSEFQKEMDDLCTT